MMPSLERLLAAAFASAAAGAIAFPPFIAVTFGIEAFLRAGWTTPRDLVGVAGLALLLSPIVFVAILAVASALGLAITAAAHRLGLTKPVHATAIAAFLGSAPAWLIFGSGVPGGNPEVVLAVAAMAAVAGWAFHRAAYWGVKPPPAPPA